jgi:transcriptional regulator with XRE-family HTH domain
MNGLFAENLRKLREERGLSQKQLGIQMFVNHSTIARWENGTRLPDAAMILRLARCLGVDVNTLLMMVAQSDEAPNVIMVDDSSVILSDGVSVLEEVMPDATIMGFIWPQEAIEYARIKRVELAVLDIEMGNSSGLELCRKLQEINPTTNVVFLTAYADYSLDAWKTEASGFILKPLTPDGIKEQLKKLRYPFLWGETVRKPMRSSEG